jgi:hypothetical protein
MMMAKFDRTVLCNPDVYFYARFVDDIVILTNGSESTSLFIDFLKGQLPLGTAFGTNPVKSRILSFVEAGSQVSNTVSFEYLGYTFTVDEAAAKGARQRIVTIDLSVKALIRAKTRVVRAFRAFHKTPNFALLDARIAFLTSNCRMNDASTNIPKLVGVYHNHPHLTCDAGCGLHQLDGLLNTLLSRNKRPGPQISSLLTVKQMSLMLRHSFVAGFTKQRYRHFTRKSLSEISECWRYEK